MGNRIDKAMKNIVFALSNNVLMSVLNFVSRTIFIYVLGSEYLGISGLMQNIFGLLAVSELGISTAIGFSLYKPLANGDKELVSSLMNLYKKAYRVISAIVLVAGIILYFYIDVFIKPSEQPKEIFYIYFLYLANIVVGYLLSYKTTLISSDQKAYKLVPIQIKVNLITIIIQIANLLILKNYLCYLTVQIVSSMLLNFIQNRYITKQYPDINFSSKKKLPKNEIKIIEKNISGLMITKLGDFLVNSTDNLILSRYVSIVSVGLYSNYLLIRDMINGYIGIFFGGITAGYGNAIAKEDHITCQILFERILFISFVMYSFEATAFLCLYNVFIETWVGEKYLFDMSIVSAIVFNNYLVGLRMPLIVTKNASGLYREDSWVPFGFAIINLVVSIVLCKKIGVLGVILGTIIGSICTAEWYRPMIVYKKIFKANPKLYFIKYFKYLVLGCVYMGSAYALCSVVILEETVSQIILNGIISIAIPLVLDWAIFRKTTEFQYLIEVTRGFINKRKR